MKYIAINRVRSTYEQDMETMQSLDEIYGPGNLYMFLGNFEQDESETYSQELKSGLELNLINTVRTVENKNSEMTQVIKFLNDKLQVQSGLKMPMILPYTMPITKPSYMLKK